MRRYATILIGPFCFIVLTCESCIGKFDTNPSDSTAGKIDSVKATRTISEIEGIAAEVAKKNGQDLRTYAPAKAYYRPTQRQWIVIFDGKESIPGNHFSVVVDDITGNIQYFPGM